MKWKTKKRKKEGDRFYSEGFLWMPLCCGTEYRWLVKAKWSDSLPYGAHYDRKWET